MLTPSEILDINQREKGIRDSGGDLARRLCRRAKKTCIIRRSSHFERSEKSSKNNYIYTFVAKILTKKSHNRNYRILFFIFHTEKICTIRQVCDRKKLLKKLRRIQNRHFAVFTTNRFSRKILNHVVIVRRHHHC